MRLEHFLAASPAGGNRLRRMLQKTGPSWAAAPLRRLLQALSLACFLVLLFWMLSTGSERAHAQAFAKREIVAAESFLLLDPLATFSAALSSRRLVRALWWTGVVLVVSLAVPRFFCGYLCPLGTLIDGFDWLLMGRLRRLSRRGRSKKGKPAAGPLKYYLLVGLFIAALGGVQVSGFLAAIPLLTRGLASGAAPWPAGERCADMTREWAAYAAAGVVIVVLLLCFFAPRFWCRYLCPTGALFSTASLLRLTERKVLASCISCGRCLEACPFGAIRPDYQTRPLECTFCQTCGGVCPTRAITFASRWEKVEAKPPEAAGEMRLTRRGFVAGASGGLITALAVPRYLGTGSAALPVRPPGSLPERDFRLRCVRCGECIRACPTRLLQPLGFGQGLEGLWTPAAATEFAGCHPECNKCTQVCPTGAIQALPLEEKRMARMGLAVVNEKTCLPHSGQTGCLLCYDECSGAGYDAIEPVNVPSPVIEGASFMAPVVLADKCVGCGLCQSRCHRANVNAKGLLETAAIKVFAGAGPRG